MPTPLLIQFLLFFGSFFLVWIGSGLVVNEISLLARYVRLSFFTVSFFLLGLLTSLPEATIGTTAILSGEPEILVGNLIGGVLVIFLLVIPLLSLVGNGVTFPSQLNRRQLIYPLIVIIAPSLLVADRRIDTWEGILLVLLYLSVVVLFARKESFLEKVKRKISIQKGKAFHRLLKMAIGFVLLIMASRQIIESAEYFAAALQWSPFLVGLIFIAIGANIPEISLILRSVMKKKKNIALAGYIGSASANTLLLGVFTLVNGEPIIVPNHFVQRLLFLAVGLTMFYIFSRSKNTLSRKEAALLILLYAAFIGTEIFWKG